MALIRPTRNAVTDRFPVAGFQIDAPADQEFEVVVTTDPALLQPGRSRDRHAGNFYSSAGEGPLSAPQGVAMYLLPPPALQSFAGNSRLYYALATRARRQDATPEIAFASTDRGPWISLDAFTGRQTRRPLMLPSAARRVPVNGASLHWMGDAIPQKAAPHAPPAARQEPAPMPANGNGNGTPVSAPPAAPVATAGYRGQVSAPLDYDDGFGPLPTAQDSEEGDDRGIESDINDVAFSLASARAMNAPAPEYPSAAEFIPAHAKSYRVPKNGRSVERVVIHITAGKNPRARATGNYFKSGAEERYVSSHYVVGQAGEVVQCVEEGNIAYHAGGANGNSIGIEHNANPKGLLPTQTQYESSADLTAYLVNKYDIPLDRDHILGHSEADPKTTHTSCPNSVWDWELYMDLVRARVGSGAPSTAQEALTAPEYPQASEYIEAHARAHREPATPRTIDKVVIHITAGSNKEARGTAVYFRDGADGRYVSSHYVVGQEGEVVQCAPESHVADHAHGANQTSIGIEHCANLKNMPVTDAQYCASAALVTYLCDKYSIPADRQHIIGHKEVPGTNKECPGPWDWDYFMDMVCTRQCKPRAASAQALDASTILSPVALKLRLFIPAPALTAPGDRCFGGDNRGFQRDGGTSRAEATAKFHFRGPNGKPQLTDVTRFFGETRRYNPSDASPVKGKPDWWRQLRAGASPVERKTLAANGDSLSVELGGDSLAGIASMPERAVVVTFKVHGANPLMTAPEIDARFSMLLRLQGDRVEARVMGGHDEFPAFELYANDTLVYSYDPVAAGGTPFGLFGTGDFDVELDTDYVDVGPASEYRFIPVRAQRVDHDHPRRQSISFEGTSFDVNWPDVFLVAQPNSLTCWAASGAMVLGWREQQSFTPDDIIRLAGRWAQRANTLPWSEHEAFAQKLGLESEPLVCYTVDGFRGLLETYGPLLVIRSQSDAGYTHAVVVTRMYGDGTPDGTFVRMLDPQGRFTGTPANPGNYIAPLTSNCSVVNGQQECYYEGGEYDLTYTVFSRLFEKGARDQLGVQVMHVPSVPAGRARTSTSQAYAGGMWRSATRGAPRGVSRAQAYSPRATPRGFDAPPDVPAPVGDEAIARVRDVMQRHAHLPSNQKRATGIELLNEGVRAFYAAVLEGEDGSPVQLGGNVLQSMSELQRLGLTQAPEQFDYLDSAGQPTAGDDRPDRLDRSVEAWLTNRVARDGLSGWHLLALSLLDGNQCALIAVQYAGVGNTATKIYWADQIDSWSEVTGGLDARLTDYTQRYWDSILAQQRKRVRTQTAIWTLAPAPVLQEIGQR